MIRRTAILSNTIKKGAKISIGMDYDAYKETHEGISKLKYQRRVREAAEELIERIRPLMEK